MKNFIKEIILLITQICIFFIFPIFSDPTDIMGLIIILYCTIALTSLILGIISDKNIKFAYPIVISIFFIITIPIYYNSNAFAYSAFMLIISTIFISLGIGIKSLYDYFHFFMNNKK